MILNRRRLACLVMMLGLTPPATAQQSALPPGPASFAPLVRRLAPSVVGIAVSELPSSPSPPHPATGPAPISQAAGSGFVVTAGGMIVTNDHVIANAAHITVTLDDGERFAARLVGTDDLTDLAVIKISAPHPLAPVRWGRSAAMQVGDWILAAGNPFALGNSFTAGIISAEGRDIGDGPFNHFLQLDAPINPGNSGGPAFNMAGAVIGVNTAIVSPSGGSVGIGFAIPSDTARIIINRLATAGGIARGWLGISVGDPQAGAAYADITGVQPGGPADRAGLTTDDAVLTVDGKSVANAAGLIRAIASLAPETKVRLGIRRNGHILTVPVIVSRRPAQLGD